MAPVAISARFRFTPFICDSCLIALRRCRPSAGTIPCAPCAKYRTSSQNNKNKPFPRHRYTANHPSALRPAILSPNLRRSYSVKPTPSAFVYSPIENGIAKLSHRRLILLSGFDSAKFLQGLISNNVDPDQLSPFYTAFFDARGRVLWDVFIWPHLAEDGSWSCLIEVDGDEVEGLLKHLKRHKLRSKIAIKSVEEGNYNIIAAWGVEVADVKTPNATVIEDPRARGFGYRILSTGHFSADFDPASVEQYQIRRYTYGIAEGPHEIARESVLPMEYNIDLMSGIDFRKGCYVGQELTIRTKHTGVVRKRILPIQLYHVGDLSHTTDGHPVYDSEWKGDAVAGADIKQLSNEGNIKKGRAAGKLITSIGNIGLALCRLEIMTPMRISAEGGSYKPGTEFGVQLPGVDDVERSTVRVKPFVPLWLREREHELWDKGRQRATP